MSIRDYLSAVLRGWWIILITAVVGSATGFVAVATTPPTYAGTVTFFVNTTPSSGVSPLQSDQYAQQRVATYVRLISSDRLAAMVKKDINSDEPTSVIAGSLSGESPLNTVLLTATATGTSRAQVLAMTRSVSTEFVTMIRQIDPTVSLEITSGPHVKPGTVAPRKGLNIGLGLGAGLLVGIAIAIARRALDTTVRGATDLRAATGSEVLGTIRRDRRAHSAPLLNRHKTGAILIEDFRRLRTNLYERISGGSSVVVVTSANYGEGKSTTAANLAAVSATDGHRVLLLDADLRRPRVAHRWNLADAPGLAEVLDGSVPLDDCLHSSGVDGLSLLSSGNSPADPAQMMGSNAMSDLLTELRKTFAVVVIDGPPLLPVTDAAIAARQADGAVVVTRHGKTTLAQAASAAETLAVAGAPLIGCVITHMPAAKHSRSLPTMP